MITPSVIYLFHLLTAGNKYSVLFHIDCRSKSFYFYTYYCRPVWYYDRWYEGVGMSPPVPLPPPPSLRLPPINSPPTLTSVLPCWSGARFASAKCSSFPLPSYPLPPLIYPPLLTLSATSDMRSASYDWTFSKCVVVASACRDNTLILGGWGGALQI